MEYPDTWRVRDEEVPRGYINVLPDEDIRIHKWAVVKEYVATAELLLTGGIENRSGHFIQHDPHMKLVGAEPKSCRV
jgi:hypothetical protein